MKMTIKFLALYFCVLILSNYLTSCAELNKKSEEESSKNKLKVNSKKISNLKPKKDDFSKIWQQLFHSQRGSACKSDLLKAKLKAKLAEELKNNNSQKSKKGKFSWVKDWGYGRNAYFLDYLDPVLLSDVLGEFNKIYKDMFALSSKDTKDYKDPFNLQKLMEKKTGGDSKAKGAYAKDLKKLNKNYEPKIFDISVNAVQIHDAMKLWNWDIDVGLKDYAVTFIKKYDFNGDGRLNPRELIIGALEHNKHYWGTTVCTHNFENVIDKIDAIFTYLDCDNDGKIGSEDIYANLKKIKRSSSKYDIFAIGFKDGVRTDAINDFILKNNKFEIGSLNKNEFRNGILYGIWDRQTDYYKILANDDNSRSQKDLRWSDGNTVDTKAFNLLKKIKKNEKKK